MGKCYQKIVVNASIDKVWETIKDFHDMSWAPNVITSVEAIGDKKGTEVGAKRILNDAFHETLIEVNNNNDNDKLSFSYSIDDGPGPVASDAVSNYIGVVNVSATDYGTLVEWSSSFNSENESEVAGFCNPIYQALLSALKETLA